MIDPAAIVLGPTERFALIGGGRTMANLALWLREAGARPTVFAAARHRDEVLYETGATLADRLAEQEIPLRSPDDINDDPVFQELSKAGALALGFGEPWTFTRRSVDLYEGRLLDVMGIPLPQYRGGAHFSWMIMAGHRNGAVHLQTITPEMVQGEFDNGDLVRSRTYQFPETARIPEDYFETAESEELAFLQEVCAEARVGVTLKRRPVDEAESLFMPRLHTPTHAWIDWRWDAAAIERFVCAFDVPYPGASTFLEDAPVRLSGVHREEGAPSFHPFQAGLVYRRYAGALWAATSGGAVRISRVFDADGVDVTAQIVPGTRFLTPEATLEQARRTTVRYSRTGLEKG